MNSFSRICTTFKEFKDLTTDQYEETTIDRLFQQMLNDLKEFRKQDQLHAVIALVMEAYICVLYSKIDVIPLDKKISVLKAIHEALEPYRFRYECVFIYLRVVNVLGYILITNADYELARHHFENVEELYDKIVDCKDKCIDPTNLFQIMSASETPLLDGINLDRLVTNNLQLQAFLYYKLNLPEKYVLYTHKALSRQLTIQDCSPLDWSLKASRLGSSFTKLKQFHNASYHLLVAYSILYTFFENCRKDEEKIKKYEAQIKNQYHELCQYWVEYGLKIFEESKRIVLLNYLSESTDFKDEIWTLFDPNKTKTRSGTMTNDTNTTINTGAGLKSCDIADSSTKTNVNLRFPELDVSEQENGIPVNLITTEDESRCTYAFVHKWWMRTKLFFKFDKQPIQFTNCVLQLADLYKNVAFFERNPENVYNLHKRRADVLEKINVMLNARTSGAQDAKLASIHIDVIKELSHVQLELMALNLQKLWTNNNGLSNNFNCPLFHDKPFFSGDLVKKKIEAVTGITSRLTSLCSQLG